MACDTCAVLLIFQVAAAEAVVRLMYEEVVRPEVVPEDLVKVRAGWCGGEPKTCIINWAQVCRRLGPHASG
jgi:hypothetical protein